MERSRPLLVLFTISVLLTELITGSTPITKFLDPFHVLLQFSVYGLMVLFIREVAVRWNLGFAGLFILGIAFGILNEGVLAQTFTKAAGGPIPQFDNYGIVAGVNVPMALIISPWHAFHAVVFPIMIVRYLYPQAADRPWFPKKFVWLLPVPSLVFGVLFMSAAGNLGYLAAFLPAIFALFFLARILPKGPPAAGPFSLRSAYLGILFAVTHFWGAVILASTKIDVVVYFMYVPLTLLAFLWVLRRKGWLQLPGILGFGIGSYMAFAFMGAVITFVGTGNLAQVAVEVLFEVIFVISLLRIKRSWDAQRRKISL